MKEYLVELDRTESGRFALTVPAVPGLLVLGDSTDDVLERARAAIEFHIRELVPGPGQPVEVVLSARCPTFSEAQSGPVEISSRAPQSACSTISVCHRASTWDAAVVTLRARRHLQPARSSAGGRPNRECRKPVPPAGCPRRAN
jgi:predicted RNase H-like HicB family nuclease